MLEPSLQHPVDGDTAHRPAGEFAGPSRGRTEEGSVLGVRGEAGGLDVLADPTLQVAAQRDLALLSAFFGEVQGDLVAVVDQLPEREAAERTHARAGVGEAADDGPV